MRCWVGDDSRHKTRRRVGHRARPCRTEQTRRLRVCQPSMVTGRDLEELLDEARESSPATRLPEYRDAIAAYGAEAIEPLAMWLVEPILAAFAIRTLERVVALDPKTRPEVVGVMATLDRATLPDPIRRDLAEALRRFGVDPNKPRSKASSVRAGQPLGSPGRPGRSYWAMRTSPWERQYIWSEATAGRLRQGWGWAAEQDLHRISRLVRQGAELSDEQQMAWPSRRMLGTEPDGMRPGDLILTPNLPEWGRLSVFELVGSYQYSPDAPRRFEDRFGHILPVELIAADFDRYGVEISEGLRATTRNPGRLWSITSYGGDVERLVDSSWGDRANDSRAWTEADYVTLFGAHPPDGERPTDGDIHRLAAELGRSVGAIGWQWSDGAAYITGRSASTTSNVLKHWLDRQPRG